MFFKSLRSRSKSSSKSTKPSTLTRILSTSSTHHAHHTSKIPEVVISPPLSPGPEPEHEHAPFHKSGTQTHDGAGRESTEDESRDYKQFLEKARKEAEKEKKEAEKKAKKAREVNMSPWASRMNC